MQKNRTVARASFAAIERAVETPCVEVFDGRVVSESYALVLQRRRGHPGMERVLSEGKLVGVLGF